MAATPLAVFPETIELRVGDALRLQLPPATLAAGEVSWFFEGAPLPGQTGPVCWCVASARSPRSTRASDSLGLALHAAGGAMRRRACILARETLRMGLLRRDGCRKCLCCVATVVASA